MLWKNRAYFQNVTRKHFFSKVPLNFFFYQHEQPKFRSLEFSKLATAGRHKNISVNYVKHNLFQQSKWSRTIDLNTTHIILFKSTRDIQPIGLIGRQLNNTQFLKDSYELATKQPFGHLLIDLDSKTSDV